jgi:hypothetical protein
MQKMQLTNSPPGGCYSEMEKAHFTAKILPAHGALI